MSKTEILTEYTTSKIRKKRKKLFTGENIFLWVMSFFLAMAVPYSRTAPFGMSCLAGERRISVKPLITLAMTVLGSMVVCDRVEVVKYFGAGVIYLGVLFVLERNIELSQVAAGIVAGSAVFISGLVGLFWQGFTFPGFIILSCEGAVVIAGTVVIDRFQKLVSKKTLMEEEFSTEEKISLCAVAAMALMSLRDVYIGTDFSIINMVAAWILMVVAAGCELGCTCITGVVLGLICGTGSEYFMPILGAYSFCGFFSGLMSRFGKVGVIGGVVLANGIIVVYTNGAMQAVITFYEILAASVMFGFVPTEWIDVAKKVITPKCGEKESIERLKNGICSRLASLALSFASMSDTIRRLSDPSTEANDGDLATVFDMAADKVCRNCPRSSSCWGEGFDYTYDALFKMMEAVGQRGEVEIGDAEAHFRAKCINLPELISEINHRFDMQQAQRVWQSKFGQNRQLVGQQFSGIANILDEISGDIAEEICSNGLSGTKIRAILKEENIKVRDVNVFQESGGRNRVELTMGSGVWKDKTRETVKNVMRNILDGEVNICDAMYENGRMVKVEISRAEKFRIETNCAVQAAADVNGDSYRFSRIGGGKYVITLSDGMGTGNSASTESRAMLELLDSFLRAGFDSRTAVKFINSVMLMKTDREAVATVDICIIDLYTGEVEFVKTGAEPSFIMKESGLETVRAASLPLGVLADVEAESCKRTVEDGDIIVMLSDGIECRRGGSLLWVSDFIREAEKEDGELKLADKILAYAVEKNSDNCLDDMTVLSVRIHCA